MPDEHCNRRLEALEASAIECCTHRRMREQAESSAEVRFNKKIETLQEDVTEIKDFMMQQKSFVGAIILVSSSVYAVITLFADKLFK